MEGGDICRADNSIRRTGSSSSSVWRNTGMEAFSGSSREEEDDEEALRWAVLEKLPTFDRLRKGILTASHGAGHEVDIHRLGIHERHTLIERLIKDAKEDSERFLMKLNDRINRVGIELPTIEVRYEHLSVETEAHAGGRALPTFINFILNILEGFLNFLHIVPSKKKHISILQDVSGIIKPCIGSCQTEISLTFSTRAAGIN